MWTRVNRCIVLAGAAAVLLSAIVSIGLARESVTFMGLLSEWQYPDAKFHGGVMSDGGNPGIQSVKCQTVLTTADPMKKVVEFYAKKLEITLDPKSPGEKSEVTPRKGRAVSIQDDSGGRPVGVVVIVVNKEKSSTTLVISREAAENETHIAWSHYLRF